MFAQSDIGDPKGETWRRRDDGEHRHNFGEAISLAHDDDRSSFGKHEPIGSTVSGRMLGDDDACLLEHVEGLRYAIVGATTAASTKA